MDQGALLQQLQEVRERIRSAAESSGREVADIQAIAVSKGQPGEKIAFFKKQGVELFGESRVQELLEKDEDLAGLSWHFIGHLQRNKVKYLLRMNNCKMIHSLDSWRLAREIDRQARMNDRIMPVLIEVNISGEESKFGLEPETVIDFMERAERLRAIDIRGLMTIAPYTEDPEETRPYFRSLVELKERLIEAGYDLPELSMGMSSDFEVAIEEGATIVRIGTALFGERGDG